MAFGVVARLQAMFAGRVSMGGLLSGAGTYEYMKAGKHRLR